MGLLVIHKLFFVLKILCPYVPVMWLLIIKLGNALPLEVVTQDACQDKC